MDVRLMPEINYNPLRGKIRECGLTQKECAAKIGLSEGQLNRKLAGETTSNRAKSIICATFWTSMQRKSDTTFFALKVEKYQL